MGPRLLPGVAINELYNLAVPLLTRSASSPLPRGQVSWQRPTHKRARPEHRCRAALVSLFLPPSCCSQVCKEDWVCQGTVMSCLITRLKVSTHPRADSRFSSHLDASQLLSSAPGGRSQAGLTSGWTQSRAGGSPSPSGSSPPHPKASPRYPQPPQSCFSHAPGKANARTRQKPPPFPS